MQDKIFYSWSNIITAMLILAAGVMPAFGVNVLQNARYSYSCEPDGTNLDTTTPYPTKLTDGLSGYSYPLSVEWKPTNMPDKTINIDFRLGTTYSIDVIMSYWLEIQQTGRYLPATIEVYSSPDRNTWNYCGTMTPVYTADNCVGQFALKVDTPITVPYIRIKVRDENISTNGFVSLVEVEAYQENFLYDDLALGTAVSYGGTLPNGTNTDSTGRRITDGNSLFDQTKSVQWNFGSFGTSDYDPYVYFKLPKTTTLKKVFADFMAKAISSIKVPTVVNLSTRMDNETGYTFRGGLTNTTSADGKINRFVWTGDDAVCDWVLLAFTRSPKDSVVSMTEVGAFGDEHVTYKHNAFRTSGVMTITCGVDAFYRPDGYVNGDWTKSWQDPSPDRFDDIVRILHDVYGYNTLYIEWDGEVDRATALQYYQIWADACANYNVEMVPVIGVVQWDYCLNVNPSALYGWFYDISPLIDVTNIDARNYFKDFVGQLLTQIPSIEEISPFDINVYAQWNSKTHGGMYSDQAIGNWINSLMTYAVGKEGSVLFQQPADPYYDASWLGRCQTRLCDTYCYLYNDDYATLQSYIHGQDSIYGSRAEGDLVIVTDAGGILDAYKQVSAANAIEAAGGELSIDNCVTAIVARGHGEYFWYNMLRFGRYVGKWEAPMEAVGTIFRRHHGIDPASYKAANLDGISPVNFADFALLGQNWLQSGSTISGDIDQDGDVDLSDMYRLACYWLADGQ